MRNRSKEHRDRGRFTVSPDALLLLFDVRPASGSSRWRETFGLVGDEAQARSRRDGFSLPAAP